MAESAEGLSCDAGISLMLTHAGPTRQGNGWHRISSKRWVIDYLNQGWQEQRLWDGPPFKRQSGIAALYAPNTVYHECRDSAICYDESWIVFDATGETLELLAALTGESGYCHLRDTEGAIGERLRQICAWMFERRPGYRFRVSGLVCELMAIVSSSQPAGANLRLARSLELETRGSGMCGEVEAYVRAHLTEPLQVGDLADHVGMGESAFAHRYPEEAGETPYQTILRLKLSEAKRLLLRKGLSIKETAYALGFSNEFNFSRAFKRVEGLSPSAYVRAMKAKQG